MKDHASEWEALEQLNRKLKEAEQLKSDFLSNIRNEINNPLSSIIALSRELMDQSDVTKEDLGKNQLPHLIYREATALDFQLKNIFTAADIESGLLYPNPSQIDLSHLMNNLIDYFKDKITSYELSINVNYNPSKLSFRSDALMLQNICMNLLANAIEYSYRKLTIQIDIVQSENKLEFVFKSKGETIPHERVTELFNRFHQLGTGTKKLHPGHGLGLSIVKALTELLAGEVNLVSGLDGITTVKVIVPEIDLSNKDVEIGAGNEFLF